MQDIALKAPIDWQNTLFLATAHGLAVVATIYVILGFAAWGTILLAFLWFALCGFSITAGYHRLFSHRAYEAHPLIRALFLFFGAAAVQNSALNWSQDHRRHHARTDTPDDPYNIRRGFWWAHIGWVLRDNGRRSADGMRDLRADRLVLFQHKHYLLLAVVAGALLPMALGWLWGDPWGGLLVAGFLRLVFQWHVTFCVNSVAHMFGQRPYCTKTSARDSFWVALLTLGEGYHNYHHRFPADFRNGIRWYHFDPSKWLIWTLSKVGLTSDLRRTDTLRIARARALVRATA